MSNNYSLILLSDMIEEFGEKETRNLLSDFSCPKNKDVETFLRSKSIVMSKGGIAQTHLVFVQHEGKNCLVGYFALAVKSFEIDFTGRNLSHRMRGRLHNFATYDKGRKVNRISAILIGQLGKNYFNNYNKLIKGKDLLDLACMQVKEAQKIAGGKVVYLECEDKPRLVQFYEKNGFINFGKRSLDRDEKDEMRGRYLLQMLKYLK